MPVYERQLPLVIFFSPFIERKIGVIARVVFCFFPHFFRSTSLRTPSDGKVYREG